MRLALPRRIGFIRTRSCLLVGRALGRLRARKLEVLGKALEHLAAARGDRANESDIDGRASAI